MSKLANRVSEKLGNDKAYATFSVRISKKHYDMLQELENITDKKPAALARACLEAAIEEYYEAQLYK